MAALFVMGNPLLDLQVRDGEPILKKFNLKHNDAILVDEDRAGIYDYIRQNHDIVYVAGGAAQNTARAAQFCLPPDHVVYTGSVGDDDLAEQLRAANAKEGMKPLYQVQPKSGEPTGACAVIIHGHDRSLITKLAAAEKFDIAHLDTPNVKAAVEAAKYFYLEGYFLTHGLKSATKLAQYASDNNKLFALNLSAPFIPQFFKDQLDTILPCVDIIFGNETEAAAFASAHGWDEKDLIQVAGKLAALPKNNAKPRTVVITQGADAVIVASKDHASPQTFPVEKVEQSQIVDTNGAGDAFAGGFLAALVAGQSLVQAVKAGIKMGTICIQQVGPTFGERQQIL